jgi:hypothetical protein
MSLADFAFVSSRSPAQVHWGDVPGWVTAAAAVIALVVACLAAKAAFDQVRGARQPREEQAAPYVIVDAEMSPASSMHMDLYVKNIGQTIARNVRVAFDPPLQGSLDAREYRRADAGFLARPIPAMPPGWEYRMLFESGPDLHKSELPRVYKATVDFDGVSGPQTLVYEIDLNLFYDFEHLTVYGAHDVAKHLKDVLAELRKWQAPGRGRGLWCAPSTSTTSGAATSSKRLVAPNAVRRSAILARATPTTARRHPRLETVVGSPSNR